MRALLARRGAKAIAGLVVALLVTSPILAAQFHVSLPIIGPAAVASTPTPNGSGAQADVPNTQTSGSQVRPADLTSHLLSGTVTNSSGANLSGITVTVYDQGGASAGTTTTNASGAYSVSLNAGTYTVAFSDAAHAYGGGRWSNTGFTPDSGTAGTVTISAADVTGINVTMPTSRHIVGTVVDPITGALANMRVTVYDQAGAPYDAANGGGTATTDSQGRYSIAVAPGTYALKFSDPAPSGGRAGGYWTITGLSYDFASSGRVNLTSVDQVLVNMTMPNVSAPGQPTGVVGTPGNAIVSLSWSAAPANGLPITGYTATSNPENKTCHTTGALTCTVTGLTNGTPYTFTVVAINAGGTGPSSNPSAAVIPVTVPGPPLTVTAIAALNSASVFWTAPASNGGTGITGYTVTSAPGAQTCTTTGALTCKVNGLTNGTPYTFTVRATNAVGLGAISDPSNSVTPAVGAPEKPTNATAASSGLGAATVSWTAPFNNGSTITGYTVTSSPGSLHCTTTGATSCTVSGLSGGVYTFTVIATNAVGSSLPSDPSNAASIYTGSTWHPITLVRVVDTRTPKGATQLVSHIKQTISFTGATGVPVGATAVTGTLVDIPGSYPGYITIAPTLTSGSVPPTSTVNFPAGDVRSVGFTVGLTPLGNADVMYWNNSATPRADMIIDITGYYANDTTGGTYHSAIGRIVDTRYGQGLSSRLTGQVKRTFQVAGLVGVPSNATAVTGNATAIVDGYGGFVTVGPSVSFPLGTSTINFPAAPLNEARSSNVTLALNNGNLDVMYSNTSSTYVDFIFDVTGYFTNDATGLGFHALLTPARILNQTTFQAQVKQTRQVGGLGGADAWATGFTGTFTVVSNSTAGWLGVAPTLTVPPPAGSTINFSTSDIRSNGVTSGLWGGYVDVLFWGTAGATVGVIIDLTGYFIQ